MEACRTGSSSTGRRKGAKERNRGKKANSKREKERVKKKEDGSSSCGKTAGDLNDYTETLLVTQERGGKGYAADSETRATRTRGIGGGEKKPNWGRRVIKFIDDTQILFESRIGGPKKPIL